MGASDLSELLSLGGDNVLCVLNVVVDQLLVGGVDQRHGEQEGGGEKRESPVRNDLNEPVGEEGTEGNLRKKSVSGCLQNLSLWGHMRRRGHKPWQKHRCSRRRGCAGTR